MPDPCPRCDRETCPTLSLPACLTAGEYLDDPESCPGCNADPNGAARNDCDARAVDWYARALEERAARLAAEARATAAEERLAMLWRPLEYDVAAGFSVQEKLSPGGRPYWLVTDPYGFIWDGEGFRWRITRPDADGLVAGRFGSFDEAHALAAAEAKRGLCECYGNDLCDYHADAARKGTP